MKKFKRSLALAAASLCSVIPVVVSSTQAEAAPCTGVNVWVNYGSNLSCTVQSGQAVHVRYIPSTWSLAQAHAYCASLGSVGAFTRFGATANVCSNVNPAKLGSPATTTTTTVRPTTTTVRPTTTSTTSTTVAAPPTTVPSSGFPVAPIADIPSGPLTAFDPPFTGQRDPPESTAHEPSGNFRTLCLPSHYGNNDPIVYPGQLNASHLHLFFGNTLTDQNSTYQSLRTTGDSTCEGGPLNRTGYWMPAVFDAQGRVVPPNLILIYYKATGGSRTVAGGQADITDFVGLPNGLRMIAGAPDGHIVWKCGDNSNIGSVIPTNCANGYLIASVEFPNCWDGVHLDSANHRSHMAYRTYNGNGEYRCPITHPVMIPVITEGFHWTAGATDVGGWYLSSDMGAPRGSTLHADWFGAWDPAIEDLWFDHCLGGLDPVGNPPQYLHMLNSNNGNLCNGSGLRGWRWVGAIRNATRLPGYTPMVMNP